MQVLVSINTLPSTSRYHDFFITIIYTELELIGVPPHGNHRILKLQANRFKPEFKAKSVFKEPKNRDRLTTEGTICSIIIIVSSIDIEVIRKVLFFY